MIFLDAAATTPVRREVLEAMWPYLSGEFGNPSSHHSLGEAAATALAEARSAVAKVLNCRAGEVTFTSGGTEADNLAVKGIALARQAAELGGVGAGEHQRHAGQRLGLCRVGAAHARMGVRRAQHEAVEQAGRRMIGDVAAGAAQERVVLPAGDGLTATEFGPWHALAPIRVYSAGAAGCGAGAWRLALSAIQRQTT